MDGWMDGWMGVSHGFGSLDPIAKSNPPIQSCKVDELGILKEQQSFRGAMISIKHDDLIL